MKASYLIRDLAGMGIKLKLEDGQLVLKGAKSALTPAVVEQIKANKEALIAFLRETSAGTETIPAQKPGSTYALSSAQQRLFLLHKMEESAVAYNIPSVFRVKGAVNAPFLEAAFNALIARHEILRTQFGLRNFEPYQEVASQKDVYFTLRTGSADTVDEASGIIKSVISAPFDLEKAPLLRAVLIGLKQTDFVFALDMHHIISDGWSMEVFIRELFACYSALVSGAEWSVAPLSIQYKDYAVWEQVRLSGDAYQAARDYWLEHFSGELPVLQLPTDKPRPGVQSFKGAQHSFTLHAALTEKLRSVAASQGASPFMVLLALVNNLLSRYSGQEDIIVGTPVAGRDLPQLKDQIGFYVNTLALRTEIVGEDTFSSQLEKVKSTLLGALSHSSYPFDRLVDELNIPRSTGRPPLFNVMVNYQEQSSSQLPAIAGVEISAEALPFHTSKFDLSFAFRHQGDRLDCTIEYATDLYLPSTIERMDGHLCTLAEAVLENPGLKPAEVNILQPEEREQVLHSFNQTAKAYDLDKDIITFFGNQVSLQPEAVALIDGETTYSYTQLDRLSNGLAERLTTSYGVGYGDLVGVRMDRSAALVIALLAVMKTGAAYVPVDPAYPAGRQSYIMEHARPRLLVTDAPSGAETLPVCIYHEKAFSEQAAGFATSLRAADRAYVIYTSGSTGTPKGISITHGNVSNLLQWAAETFDSSCLEGVLFSTSVCFDLSIYELFYPLSAGGTVILAKTVTDLAGLAAALKVRLVNTVPSAVKLLLEQDAIGPRVKVLNVAGEPLKDALVQRVFEKTNVEQVNNLYGPSETTTYSTHHRMERGEEVRVTIGKPLANTQVYLLDRGMNLVPPGVFAELYIGGSGVSEGYLHSEDLTAQRFLANPYGAGQLYRTGDLASWDGTGQLHYHGRIDEQVKLRGFRIELGEIEKVLMSRSEVKEAVAVVKGSGEDAMLVAYMTVEQGAEQAEDYRKVAAGFLPDYMVPSVVVVLENLPLTPNGKIDKKALPDPVLQERAYVAAASETEAVLQTLWQEVLGLEKVGVTDNFFAIGGNSIKAMKLAARIFHKTGTSVKIKDIFLFPTIRELAPALKNCSVALAPIPLTEATGEVPASLAQRRIYWAHRLQGGEAAYNIPFYLELRGSLKEEVLHDAVQYLIERHESLRTVFREEKGQLLQEVKPRLDAEDVFVYEYQVGAPLLGELAAEESKRIFDLGAGPLWKLRVVCVGANHYFFGLTFHHIIADGWSMPVFFRDLMKACMAFGRDEKPDLQPLPVQYRDYSEWQRKALLHGEFKEAAAYWGELLSGELAYTTLPYDYLPDEKESSDGDRVIHSIDTNVSDKVVRFALSLGCTPFTVLYSTLQALLSKYTSESDIVLGIPVSGRVHPYTVDQVGLYINTILLRAEVKEETSFAELCKANGEQLSLSLEHQEYPFSAILEDLQVPADKSPLFAIMVNYEDQTGETDFIKDIPFTLKQIDSQYAPSKFDISITFANTDGRLKILADYNKNLYSRGKIERLIHHFEKLVRVAVENKETSLKEHTYLSKEEAHTLRDLGRGEVLNLPYGNIISRFDLIAEKLPDHTAIVEDEVVTYSRLRENSCKLAQTMAGKYGVKAGVVVAVSMDRSAALVTTILAILRCKAIYLPIDMDDPHARKSYIISDSRPVLMVAAADTLSDCVVESYEALSAEPDVWDNLPPKQPETDLPVYRIYTSGTTGKPKGVTVSSFNLANLCEWHITHYQTSERSRATLFAGIGFDASVWEIFPYLLTGGTLYPVAANLRYDTGKLGVFMQEKGITHTYLPVVIARQLLSSEFKPDNPVHLLTGGEDPGMLCSNEKIILHNNYGPTETTVVATSYRFRDKENSYIPIGRPLPNTHIYLLDENHKLVGEGLSGSIFIGGRSVSLGYHGQDDLTEKVFVADPFNPGHQMYNSGDKGRWLPDGNLLFEGRKDEQVKLRGYRIELSGIDYQLKQIPCVSEAVTLLLTDTKDHKRLVSYVKVDGEVPEIRNLLSKALPSYMIPDLVVVVDTIPLTANGKVDRKALPSPDFGNREIIAPRNDLEMVVRDTFREVLDVEELSIYDSFFALGGQSIKLYKLASALAEKTGVHFNLSDLFVHNTIAGVAGLLEEGKEEVTIIPYADIRERYPLSSSQFRMWMLSGIDKSAQAYNIVSLHNVKGQVNFSLLEEALTLVIGRHEILRTRFVQQEEEVYQVIDKNVSGKITLIEPGDESLADLLKNVPALESGNLLSLRFLKRAEDDYLMIFSMHHIISDGWSMEVFIRELFACYSALVSGREWFVAPLSIQYKDYAVWEQARLSGDAYQAARDYWLEHFSGELPVLQLPTDKPRPGVQSFKGAQHSFTLHAALTEKLRSVAASQGASPFMVLLALVNNLLSRYSGQEDIIVGTPVAGRDLPQLKDQIGFYVNTLALRTEIVGEDTFSSQLEKVKSTLLGALSHSSYPFDRLVDELNIPRSTGRPPLFNVMVNYQEQSSSQLPAIAGVEIVAEALPFHTSKFDLSFAFRHQGDRLDCTIEYATDLYGPVTIERMGRHLVSLCEAVLENPGIKPSEVDILQAEERAQVLYGFNQTERAYDLDKDLISLFREQTVRQPEAIALIDGETSYSYGQLDRLSSGLAHRLITNYGVAHGDLVAVRMERSAALVIALIAIMKTGAAYVPVDPGYPAGRQSYILEHARPRLLVTDKPKGENALLVCSYNTEEFSEAEGLSISLQSTDRAYVIYTSGSTGNPKGISITHGNVSNLLQWATETFDSSCLEGVLFSTSVCFDLSIYELFYPLSAGGTVILAKTVTDLPHLAVAEQVRLVNTVPSAVKLLLDQGAIGPQVKVLNVAGEPLKDALVRRVFENTQVQQVNNLYGPSETTTYSTHHRMERGKEVRVTIGKPLANTQVYMMDRGMNLVPPGVFAELYIGGSGVSEGYLHSAELTAQRFLVNPYGEGHLYRTGDLASWDGEGQLHYHGRIDEQVKLRGFRIELGEIEKVLMSRSEVKEAVAVVKGSGEDAMLVAYIAIEPGADLSADYRQVAAGFLPDYMVPSVVMVLESLPLTPNGKIDKKALPDPVLQERAYVAAASETEAVLQTLWQEVLGLEKVSVTDNFFAIGGNSIKAMKLAARLKKLNGKEISLSEVFTYPQIDSLAAHIETLPVAGSDAIQTLGKATHYALSNNQKRLWITEMMQGSGAAYNITQGIIIEGVFNAEILIKALRYVTTRHEVVRSRFVTVDNAPVAIVVPSDDFFIPVGHIEVGQDENSYDSVKRIIDESQNEPFDLYEGSLLRLKIVKIGEFETGLIYTLHHIVTDGISNAIFEKELVEAYLAYADQKSPGHTPLPVQYYDFAAWQNGKMELGGQEVLSAYWKNRLKGNLPVLNLPLDTSRLIADGDNTGKLFHGILDNEILARLNQVAANASISLYALLLSAYNVLLQKASGQDTILTGISVAGREQEELQPLIGFFVNTLPFKATIPKDISFGAFAQQTQQALTQDLKHQAMPFDQILNNLNISREPGTSPVFQSRFVFNNYDTTDRLAVSSLTDLKISQINLSMVQAKFDLSLMLFLVPDGLNVTFEYRSRLFREDTISTLWAAFSELLKKIADNPGLSLNDLDTYTDKRRGDMVAAKEKKASAALSKLKNLKVNLR
ncbi:amino acid adenylation domain-containing protein [Roseivirga sp. BDSF3-8]|uniref:amino acid adenylation domain-containing protein n=1 Tax=Roseivirga sp. BDSF3-8 TaxID=3241598 RepID=UPI003531847A